MHGPSDSEPNRRTQRLLRFGAPLLRTGRPHRGGANRRRTTPLSQTRIAPVGVHRRSSAYRSDTRRNPNGPLDVARRPQSDQGRLDANLEVMAWSTRCRNRCTREAPRWPRWVHRLRMPEPAAMQSQQPRRCCGVDRIRSGLSAGAPASRRGLNLSRRDGRRRLEPQSAFRCTHSSSWPIR